MCFLSTTPPPFLSLFHCAVLNHWREVLLIISLNKTSLKPNKSPLRCAANSREGINYKAPHWQHWYFKKLAAQFLWCAVICNAGFLMFIWSLQVCVCARVWCMLGKRWRVGSEIRVCLCFFNIKPALAQNLALSKITLQPWIYFYKVDNTAKTAKRHHTG